MLRSLAVILVPLLIITALFTHNLSDHPVTVVDWKPVVAQARAQAPFPVLAPVNLPSTWRATRASWTPRGTSNSGADPAVRNTYELGFLDPDDVYIAIGQGDTDPADFLSSVTKNGVADGTSQVNGQTWQRRLSSEDQTRSLVQSSAAVTSIVFGDTSYEALEAFAGTLRAS